MCRKILINLKMLSNESELYRQLKLNNCNISIFDDLLIFNKIIKHQYIQHTQAICKFCNTSTNINLHRHHLKNKCPNIIFNCSIPTCDYKANRETFIKEHLYKQCDINFNICKDCCTPYQNNIFSGNTCIKYK